MVLHQGNYLFITYVIKSPFNLIGTLLTQCIMILSPDLTYFDLRENQVHLSAQKGFIED